MIVLKGHVGFAFVLLMLIPFLLFIPELIVYGVQTDKANALAEQTTKQAELLGGITPEVQQRFNEALEEYKLDPEIFSVSYSNNGAVQRNGKFVVQVQGQYTFRTFNVLGTGLGNFSLPITATDSGVSEVWIR